MKRYIVALVIAVILIGVVAGYNNKIEIESITGLLFSYKMLYISLGIILLLFILSLIGIPAYVIFIIIDLFIYGALIYIFITNFSYKGLIYLLIYFITLKIPLYFLLLLNTFYTLKYAKNLYRFIFNRFGKSVHNIKLYFKKIVTINIILYIFFVFYNIIGGKLMGLLANYLFF